MQLKPSCTLWGPKQSPERTSAIVKKKQFFCETSGVLSTALPKAYLPITPATEELSDASFSSVPWGASHISHTPRTITKLCGYVPTAGSSKTSQSHTDHCCFQWIQLSISCAPDRLHISDPAQLPSNLSFRVFICFSYLWLKIGSGQKHVSYTNMDGCASLVLRAISFLLIVDSYVAVLTSSDF